jgi:uncharacterized protein YjbI with pentapeptide repeats
MAGEQVGWTRCGHEGCIGAQLPTTTLCLGHAAEQAPDAFAAELRRIGAEGTVDARGVSINAQLLRRLLAAAPRQDDRPAFTAAQFDQASFQDGARFHETSFQGVAVFDAASFQGRAWFGDASFQGEARFHEASFQGEAWFGGASFQDTAMFGGAGFQSRTWFGQASFHSKAWFIGVTFQDEAEFGEATFQREAGFDQATFQREARFWRVSFQREARFTNASFCGRAGFAGASFEGEAGFGGASFQDPAGFGEASFQGVAEFRGARFQTEVWFGQATFQGEARFDGATFQSKAWFDGASFERARKIGPLLAREVVLDGAVFGAPLQLEVTAAAVCARRAQFSFGAHLRLRFASINLDDANVAAPAILAGAPSPFSWLAQKEHQFASGWPRLPPGPRAQRWRPRLLQSAGPTWPAYAWPMWTYAPVGSSEPTT